MVMVCSLGSGTTAMDNMGQIGLSLGYTQVQINTLVALLSIWNCFGRFGGGFISELLLHSKDIPRPFSLALSLVSECFDTFVCVCMHVCFFTYQFQKMEPPSFEMINPPWSHWHQTMCAGSTVWWAYCDGFCFSRINLCRVHHCGSMLWSAVVAHASNNLWIFWFKPLWNTVQQLRIGKSSWYIHLIS